MELNLICTSRYNISMYVFEGTDKNESVHRRVDTVISMSGKVTSMMDNMDMDEYSGDQDNDHTRHLHEWI